MSKVYKNSDGRTEHHICAAIIFVLSMLSQDYNIIFDLGVIAPRHVRYVVDSLDSTKIILPRYCQL